MSSEQYDDVDPPAPRAVSRREALKRAGGGGLGILGAGVVLGVAGGRAVAAAAADASESEDGYDGVFSGDSPTGDAAGPYGHDSSVPEDLEAGDLDARTFPPPPVKGTVEVEMAVVEKSLQVSHGYAIDAWTYNGSAPGPILRATEGDLIRVHFTNRTGHDHNLHFHGRHSPIHDGWEPVPPGGETVYEIEAGPAGVHPYHCHTMPIDRHIARGLYGTLIVDPKGGRPPANEIVLALSGWDVDDDGRNELYVWNGVAGYYDKFPIKLPVGEPVRAYVLNMVEFDPLASFHLHAEMFDVYPAGAGEAPAFTTDIVTMGQMDRVILEFRLSELGRYMFHPHQHSMMSRGAMGWFAAI